MRILIITGMLACSLGALAQEAWKFSVEEQDTAALGGKGKTTREILAAPDVVQVSFPERAGRQLSLSKENRFLVIQDKEQVFAEFKLDAALANFKEPYDRYAKAKCTSTAAAAEHPCSLGTCTDLTLEYPDLKTVIRLELAKEGPPMQVFISMFKTLGRLAPFAGCMTALETAKGFPALVRQEIMLDAKPGKPEQYLFAVLAAVRTAPPTIASLLPPAVFKKLELADFASSATVPAASTKP